MRGEVVEADAEAARPLYPRLPALAGEERAEVVVAHQIPFVRRIRDVRKQHGRVARVAHLNDGAVRGRFQRPRGQVSAMQGCRRAVGAIVLAGEVVFIDGGSFAQPHCQAHQHQSIRRLRHDERDVAHAVDRSSRQVRCAGFLGIGRAIQTTHRPRDFRVARNAAVRQHCQGKFHRRSCCVVQAAVIHRWMQGRKGVLRPVIRLFLMPVIIDNGRAGEIRPRLAELPDDAAAVMPLAALVALQNEAQPLRLHPLAEADIAPDVLHMLEHGFLAVVGAPPVAVEAPEVVVLHALRLRRAF